MAKINLQLLLAIYYRCPVEARRTIEESLEHFVPVDKQEYEQIIHRIAQAR